MAEYEILHEKSPVFYDRYERKSELQHQTHYCPGCGHGVAHKLIAEAIEELGLQDEHHLRQPGGLLGVRLLLLQHRQRAGGARARAGGGDRHQARVPGQDRDQLPGRRRPGGDRNGGDRSRRQSRREDHRVLHQQRDLRHDRRADGADDAWWARRRTTSPWGRRPSNEGFPLHVSEMLATLEAPVYIERVALSDNKNIMQARKAIRKALELQRDNAGFSLVEILSPCPTIWKQDPVEARKFDRRKNDPGVSAGRVSRSQAGDAEDRRSAEERCRGAGTVRRHRSETGAATSWQGDAPSRWPGSAGRACCCWGVLLAEMGMREHMEVSWLPSYGPEMRSGSAHCHVCLSKERIGSPLVSHPEVLVAMNEQSLRKFAPTVAPGGLILYNRDSLPEDIAIAARAGDLRAGVGDCRPARIGEGGERGDAGRAAGGNRVPVAGDGDGGDRDDGEKAGTGEDATKRRCTPGGCTSITR